jgi:uncharacterized membrane protein
MDRVTLSSVSWIARNYAPLLGQESDTGSVLFWAFVLILLIVLGFLAAISLRKWLSKVEEEPENPMGFTLGDLRVMHQKGQITTEEFEKARTQMIAATKRAAERAAQAAMEMAKKQGGTDIDALRARARLKNTPAASVEGGPEAVGTDEASAPILPPAPDGTILPPP